MTAMQGHRGRNGQTKISYPTEAAARAAARPRSVLWGSRFVAYRCRKPDRLEHYHIGNYNKPPPAGQRFHEEWNDVLTTRVAGCMWVENNPKKALRALRQRALAAAVGGDANGAG